MPTNNFYQSTSYPSGYGRDGATELDPDNPIGATRIGARKFVRAVGEGLEGFKKGVDYTVQQSQRVVRDFGRTLKGERLIPPLISDARDAGISPPLFKDLGQRAPLVAAPVVPIQSSLPMAPIVPQRGTNSLIVERCLQNKGGQGCYESSYSSVVGSGINYGNSGLANCIKGGGGRACYQKYGR
ncbi:hypothetical protein PN499_26400 [Kamptonema animale CS-326]|jgi:hypothetical protein|uniref:hypothetical protein n=1 Tax=Kamptonema animale TaxID=92934 RepID=UPI00232A8A0F|nr:hypothetical protein [Kamptonema animale]MDB9514739.1 hypothetical protein [Kamptonema animale CS-326]